MLMRIHVRCKFPRYIWNNLVSLKILVCKSEFAKYNQLIMSWRCYITQITITQIYFQPPILILNSSQPFSVSEIRDDRSVVTPYEGFRFISCCSEFGLQHNTQMLDHNIGQLLISSRRFSFFFSSVFFRSFVLSTSNHISCHVVFLKNKASGLHVGLLFLLLNMAYSIYHKK